ncbi:MAG: putative prokaryotic signal transducing protein [Myxococcaceae bacterium]|nr:putative prokaryotic signal transducing protein [Myxococcaceae bacterium]
MADTFSIVRTTEDPLTAERLVEVLREEKIDAFARPRGAASSASFEPAEAGFYELFVPDTDIERAAKIVELELESIEKEGALNAQAAEEEALSGETPVES